MRIANRQIDPGQSTFIVAELSCNHCGDLALAHQLIDLAKHVGADAVKFQTFQPHGLAWNGSQAAHMLHRGPWKGRKLYDLYTEAQTPRVWHPELFGHARDIGLVPFSAPLTPDDVEFLEFFDCPAYKIPSPEIVDLDLLRTAAGTLKPVILSTGMASPTEVRRATTIVRHQTDLVLLHCISGYPTPSKDCNLNRMKLLRSIHPLVGLSDHSIGHQAAVMAVALGAPMVEKHLMLDGTEPLDSAFSARPLEFQAFVAAIREAETMLGKPQPRPASEEASQSLRRRLVALRAISEGERFTEANLGILRCGEGLLANEKEQVLGRTAKQAIVAGSPISQDLI